MVEPNPQLGLARSITEHRLGIIKGLTTRNNLNKLVYYEAFASMEAAFLRESN
jgi:predicted GIY-YIG superfamily endonuclease